MLSGSLFFKSSKNTGEHKVVDGNIKKTLDLLGVQIHCQDTVYPAATKRFATSFEVMGHGLIFSILTA